MKLTSLRRTALRFLVLPAAVYLGVVIAVAVWQNHLIYFPSPSSAAKMIKLADEHGMQPWRDRHGVIIGWKSVARADHRAANRLVLFHGNTGVALQRVHFSKGFEAIDDGRLWQVFLFEYPGFGARSGRIGRASLVQAGAAMFETLSAEDQRPIYLIGESLGSGLACHLASRHPETAGLFLITPYLSIEDVAAVHYPWLPVSWIVRDQWDNRRTLDRFHGPVAMMLAEHDEIIPVAQGRALFAEAAGRKRLWVMSGATHNGIDFSPSAPWWQEVSAFLLEPR